MGPIWTADSWLHPKTRTWIFRTFLSSRNSRTRKFCLSQAFGQGPEFAQENKNSGRGNTEMNRCRHPILRQPDAQDGMPVQLQIYFCITASLLIVMMGGGGGGGGGHPSGRQRIGVVGPRRAVACTTSGRLPDILCPPAESRNCGPFGG